MNDKSESGKSRAARLVGLLAETHIHVGVGQSVEALDLPVARERVTHFPFVPGSGVKGAFNVWAREDKAALKSQADFLFGKEGSGDDGGDGNAGALLCSDARLLLLPVRAMSSAYRWVTCPAILRRFARDAGRCGESVQSMKPTNVDRRKYLGPEELASKWLGLEEREFERQGGIDDTVFTALEPAVPHATMRDTLRDRLVILHDDDFVWFARYALPVMARNRLDENKRVVRGQLWHEEAMPPDAVLYLTLGERAGGAVDKVVAAMAGSPYVQMGGNETVGHGWFIMAPFAADAPAGGSQ